MSPHQNAINLSPKEISLELTLWVPLGQVLILLFLLFDIFLSRRSVTVIVVVEEEGVFFDIDEKFEIIEFSPFDKMSLEGVKPTTFEYADIDLTI